MKRTSWSSRVRVPWLIFCTIHIKKTNNMMPSSLLSSYNCCRKQLPIYPCLIFTPKKKSSTYLGVSAVGNGLDNYCMFFCTEDYCCFLSFLDRDYYCFLVWTCVKWISPVSTVTLTQMEIYSLVPYVNYLYVNYSKLQHVVLAFFSFWVFSHICVRMKIE